MSDPRLDDLREQQRVGWNADGRYRVVNDAELESPWAYLARRDRPATSPLERWALGQLGLLPPVELTDDELVAAGILAGRLRTP